MNSISTEKQKLEQQLQTLRHANIQLMKVKMQKKKIDLNGRFDKKDIHNILNSLLQADIFQQDLFNQFWDYYFQKSVNMIDFMKAYSNTIIILIEKIVQNDNKISQLTKEREILKQNHEYKKINTVNLDLQTLAQDNRQFHADLQEYSKPFQFHFQSIIEKFNAQFQNSLRVKSQIQNKQNVVNKNKQLLLDFLMAFNQSEKRRNQQQQQIELTEQQKFYRFIIYIFSIVFMLQLSMVFNKYNFVDLVFGFILLINSLFENYLLKNDLTNKIVNKIEINFIEDKIVLKDVITEYDVRKLEQQTKQTNHNFQNYVNSSIIVLAILILWDLIWVILSFSSYNNCESNAYRSQSMNCSFWKYNHYIIFGSIMNLLAKITIFIAMFQVATITFQRIFSKHNYYILVYRLYDYHDVINELTNIKK